MAVHSVTASHASSECPLRNGAEELSGLLQVTEEIQEIEVGNLFKRDFKI